MKSMEIRKIIALTDFSTCARLAYAPAAEWARRFGASVFLVHAFPPQFDGAQVHVEGRKNVTVDYREALEERLDAEVCNALLRECRPRAVLLSGRAPDVVIDFAEKEKADLIIQSSHGRSGWSRAFLGSFAEGVIRRSSIPVLTFRGEREGNLAPRRILYPFDFSDAARIPLETIRLLASAFESQVLVFHAIPTPPLLPLPVGAEPLLTFHPEPPGLRDRLRSELKGFADAELGGISHDVDIVRDDPGSVIVERAMIWRADLVAMATHGIGGIEGFLLGNTAEKVVRSAPCAVLTVRSSTCTAVKGKQDT